MTTAEMIFDAGYYLAFFALGLITGVFVCSLDAWFEAQHSRSFYEDADG